MIGFIKFQKAANHLVLETTGLNRGESILPHVLCGIPEVPETPVMSLLRIDETLPIPDSGNAWEGSPNRIQSKQSTGVSQDRIYIDEDTCTKFDWL